MPTSYLTGRQAGLPDGVFSKQKSKFGSILEGLRMENIGIFYVHLEYFTAIWYNLWPFGNVDAFWYIFPRFGILCLEKSGNPAGRARHNTTNDRKKTDGPSSSVF
jgi:hypothetical protein